MKTSSRHRRRSTRKNVTSPTTATAIPDYKPSVQNSGYQTKNLLQAGQLCATEVPVVSKQTTVAECALKMRDSGADCVLVEERGALRGIFTDNDMVRKIVSTKADPATTLVKDVMSSKVFTIPPDCDILKAVLIMMDHKFRHMPVVKDGTTFGLIYMHHCIAAVVSQLRTTALESDEESCASLSMVGMSLGEDLSSSDSESDHDHDHSDGHREGEGDDLDLAVRSSGGEEFDADVSEPDERAPDDDRQRQGDARQLHLGHSQPLTPTKQHLSFQSPPSTPNTDGGHVNASPNESGTSARTGSSRRTRSRRRRSSRTCRQRPRQSKATAAAAASASLINFNHTTEPAQTVSASESKGTTLSETSPPPSPSSFELLKILSKMTLSEIVRAGRTASPAEREGCRVVDVVRKMARYGKTGAVIKHRRTGHLKGIITSKDILGHFAKAISRDTKRPPYGGRSFRGGNAAAYYNQAVTSKLYTAHPDTVPETMTVVEALEQMQQQGYTHLPVLAVGELSGVDANSSLAGGSTSADSSEGPGRCLGIVDAMELVTAILSTKDKRLSDNPRKLVQQIWALSTPPQKPRTGDILDGWSLNDAVPKPAPLLNHAAPAVFSPAKRQAKPPVPSSMRSAVPARPRSRSRSRSGSTTRLSPDDRVAGFMGGHRSQAKTRRRSTSKKRKEEPTPFSIPVPTSVEELHDVQRQLRRGKLDNPTADAPAEEAPKEQVKSLLDYSLALNEHIDKLQTEKEQQKSNMMRAAGVGLVVGGLLSFAGTFLARRR